MNQQQEQFGGMENISPTSITIIAGVFVGVGVGYLINNLVAGTMLGLGGAFVLIAYLSYQKNKKKKDKKEDEE